MAERLLTLSDLDDISSPEKIASLFKKIGYNACAQQLAKHELGLPARSAEAVLDLYLIANHQKGTESLQVWLFKLKPEEWLSPSVASNRMRSLAQSLCKRPSNFLLLGTKDYKQLMLVNPRKSFDADMNLKVNIRKLLIDCTKPSPYDLDILEAIAAGNLSPQKLYEAQCDAFDVEKLTKNFYQGYREIFKKVQQVIKDNNPHPYFEDPSRLHQFSQRLLGRVMFLYFLQKKEFLGSGDFLKNDYPKLNKPEPEDADFYETVLEPLFFDTLNKQRPNNDSPWGKIPYLNGGLFEKDYGVGIIDAAGVPTPPKIHLPNFLFDPSAEEGVLNFFNSYNFTVAENLQGDEEAAVDPEMLGKVFENLLVPEERKKSGTFYTPRGIVHFMCVESLSRYLADSTGMDVEAIKKLIELDFEQSDTDFTKLLTKEQARKLKQALETVKICDPAVGSGAFLLGMMQVILAIKQAIACREEEQPVQRGTIEISDWKRDIIANNLHGVDIKPEAIEIAKLRMWLSMVVDIPTIDKVKPLPNLDYKLMCGDSLISTINGERLIPDPTKDQRTMLAVNPVQAAIQPVVDLQHQYFTSHADKRKVLREKIVEAEKNVFRVAIADRRRYWETEQRNLQQDIKRLKRKGSRAQTSLQQEIANKLGELDNIADEVERGMRSLNSFQWHLHFNEVFLQKGGFDIVISNPPYVFTRNSKEKGLTALDKKYLYDTFQLAEYQINLYPLFIEQGHFILHSEGLLSYITPNNWLTVNTNKKLRKFVLEQSDIQIVNFYNQVFDSASVDNAIVIFKKEIKSNKSIKIFEYKDHFKLVRQLQTDYFLNQKNT